jgi:hypothetical protein
MDTAEKDGVSFHQIILRKSLKTYIKDLVEETTRVFKPPSAPKSLNRHRKEVDTLNSLGKQKQNG